VRARDTDEAARGAVLEAAARSYGLGLAADARERLVRYCALVMKWQRVTNLTGAADALAFAREHVVDCLALLPHLGPGSLLDVGSGAGLPGLVVAAVQPQRPVTLLEPRGKRVRFLEQARIELALDAVTVVAGRAEAHHPVAPYRYVVTRAFSSLAGILAATRHLLGPDTELLAMKAEVDGGELAAAGVDAPALEMVMLDVPGYRERRLLRLAGARVSGAGPDVP